MEHRRVAPLVQAGRRAAAFAALVLGSAAAIACSSAPDESGAASRTGQEVFAATCAACHGAAGQGQPNWHVPNDDGTLPAPPLNGDGHTWHHSDGLLYRIVSQGGTLQEAPGVTSFKSAMPAFGGQLSHDEIVAVLTYVKGLWGEKTSRGLSIREAQALASEDDPFPSSGG